MNRLFILFILMLTIFAGCNSSTGNDDNNGNNDGNNTGNGGKYTIFGSVHLNTVDGAGISVVTVVLSSLGTAATTPLTMTTGSDGAFSFGNITAGSYIVTVAKTNFTFIPQYVSVTVTDKNVAVQTFVGTTVNTGGNAGTASLYPFKTNATWTYDSVNLVSSFAINEKVIEKVTGTMVKGGKTYWACSSTTYDSDNVESDNDISYLRVENNVVYMYSTDFLTAKSAFKAAKPIQDEAIFKMTQSGSVEYPLFKFNVTAGTVWDIYKDSGSSQGGSYSITSTGKYVGTETVGSYSNCAKYELEYSTESVTSSMKIAGKWFSTIWLAPNVGPVKTIKMFYSGDTLADLSLLSTTTNTLKAVQLP